MHLLFLMLYDYLMTCFKWLNMNILGLGWISSQQLKEEYKQGCWKTKLYLWLTHACWLFALPKYEWKLSSTFLTHEQTCFTYLQVRLLFPITIIIQFSLTCKSQNVAFLLHLKCFFFPSFFFFFVGRFKEGSTLQNTRTRSP